MDDGAGQELELVSALVNKLPRLRFTPTVSSRCLSFSESESESESSSSHTTKVNIESRTLLLSDFNLRLHFSCLNFESEVDGQQEQEEEKKEQQEEEAEEEAEGGEVEEEAAVVGAVKEEHQPLNLHPPDSANIASAVSGLISPRCTAAAILCILAYRHFFFNLHTISPTTTNPAIVDNKQQPRTNL